jgi:hypothetical protein
MSRYDYTYYPSPLPMGLMGHLSHPKSPRKMKLPPPPTTTKDQPTTAKDAISQVRLDVQFARSQSTNDFEAAVMTSITVLEMLLAEIDRAAKAERDSVEALKACDTPDLGAYIQSLISENKKLRALLQQLRPLNPEDKTFPRKESIFACLDALADPKAKK